MKTFILFWNPGISSYTIERLREDLDAREHVSNWSVWEHKKAHKGDRFFMVRCGEGKTGICMSGFFSSEPYQDEDWSGKGREVYYMDLRADIVIDPDILPILPTEILSQKIPSFDWSGGHSGRLLLAPKAKKLEKLWKDFLEKNNPMFGKLALRTYVTHEDIMGFDDDYESYCATIDITEDGEFAIQSVADDVEVVGEDLETVKKEFAKKMKEAGKTIPIEFEVWKVENQELFQKALDIANEAYCGMKDEYGQPYIKRALKETEDSYSDVGILVCLLHYVLKNPEFTTNTLLQRGIPKVVVDAVEVLYQKEDESYEQYIQRIGENPAASYILYNIIENRLDIKKISELSLDRFTGLAQDLKAYHYLDEMQRKSSRAVFRGSAKDFDMWFDLYGDADTIAICGEYNDDEVAEMSRLLTDRTTWSVDISELNVGRWAKDNPHEATYEEEILWKLSEDGTLNCLEKMMLNRKYDSVFVKRWGQVVTKDGKVLVHVPVDCEPRFEKGIEIVGCAAVANNKKLRSLIYPNGLTAIDDYAFVNCDELVSVRLPDTVTRIGEMCFHSCAIEDLVISKSLIEIPYAAFSYNDIDHLEIPASVKRIAAEAFQCNYIGDEDLVVPEGVEVIECNAFRNPFKHVYLPSTLKEIAYDFYFEEMIDDPEEWKPYVEIHPDNPVYYSEGGILYRRDTGKEALGKAGREQSEQ